jgi:acetoin utilization protein AcuB
MTRQKSCHIYDICHTTTEQTLLILTYILAKKGETMLYVQNLMTSHPQTIAPQATLREAVALMNKAENRQLPVVDKGNLVGILTDRDVRLRVNSPLTSTDPIERIQLLECYTVADCMTTNPLTVTPDMPIYRVAQLLSLYKFGSFPVVKAGELVGIITVTDLLAHMALQPVV